MITLAWQFDGWSYAIGLAIGLAVALVITILVSWMVSPRPPCGCDRKDCDR